MGWPPGTHAEYRAHIGYVILIRLSTLPSLIQINDMYIKGFGTAQRHASTTSGQRQFHREGRRVINISSASLRLCCCSCCRRRNWRHLFGSCSRSRRDQFAGAQWQLACASINRSWWGTRFPWQLQLGRSVRTGPFIVGCHGATGHGLQRGSPVGFDARPLTDIDLLADLIEQLQQCAGLLVLELNANGGFTTRGAAGIEQNESEGMREENMHRKRGVSEYFS